MDRFSVSQRLIVVTGAAGNLGSEYCRYFLRNGAYVAGLDSAPAMHADFDSSIATETFSYHVVDIADATAIEETADALQKKYGAPFGLVNNAAIDFPPEPTSVHMDGVFPPFSDSQWERVMEVNVKGTYNCIRAIGRRMFDAGRGAIVNVGSIYGCAAPDNRIYLGGASAPSFKKPMEYGVSKAALFGLTQYSAALLAPRVRVNLLILGGVFLNQSPEFVEKYSAKVPLGRMAKSDEYCESVHFLLSDAASYVTGTHLVADGGYLAC